MRNRMANPRATIWPDPFVIENLELDFSHRPPQVSGDQVGALCAYLTGKGWVKAAKIEAETEINERLVRRLAEKSDGQILSGQKGYRLFDASVSLEEADHAANWLISQGKTMIRRGVSIRRRFHRFARP